MKQPTEKNKSTSESSRIVLVILFFVLVGYFAPGTERSQEIEATADKAKDQEFAWIENTKEAISEKLKDPTSAKFRNTRFTRYEGTPMVCGEVNSKNSFGGFTGYQRFVASGEYILLLEEQAADFHNVWNKVCIK